MPPTYVACRPWSPVLHGPRASGGGRCGRGPVTRRASLRPRGRAGFSGADIARFLGGERAVASLIESGRYGVSAERVRRLAAHCSATDEHLVNVLAAMAEERGTRKGVVGGVSGAPFARLSRPRRA
ncbi:helix-turn-helix domain-containing protein [Streptomyces sp. NPDC091278]|uniref:helix-turn-helix domain-containing protein n=1 Tax=Streptomyces sp. NPDC091278 TaxID=3155301 RepID=UPI00344B46EA